MDDGESPDCYGVYNTETGAIVKQKGYTKWVTDPVSSASFPDITGIHYYKLPTTNQYILVMAGGELYRYNVDGTYKTKINVKMDALLICDKMEQKIYRYSGCSNPSSEQNGGLKFYVVLHNITGLAWDFNRVWSCDSSKIYKHKVGLIGEIENTYNHPIPGVGISGLCCRNGVLWSCGYNVDGTYCKVYKHKMDATFPAIDFSFSVATDGVNPLGINLTGLAYSWNSDYIWVAIKSTNKIAKYTSTGVYLTSWNAPNPSPSGLGMTPEGSLFITDDTTNKIYQVSLSGIIENTWNAPSSNLSGIEPASFLPVNFSSFDKVDFATFNDVVYFCNGDDLIFWYDYKQYSDKAYPLYNSPINARFIKVYQNYLIAGGFNDLSNICNFTNNSSEIRRSGLLDATSWNINDYNEFNPDDGEKIRGFTVYRDDLIVFKNNSSWKMSYTGDWDTPFYQTFLNWSGLITGHSLIEVNQQLYYVSNDGIKRFDGVNVVKISNKISNSFPNFLYHHKEDSIDVVYIKELEQIRWTIPSWNYGVSNLTYDLLTDSFFVLKDYCSGDAWTLNNFYVIDKWENAFGESENRYYLASSYKYIVEIETGDAFDPQIGTDRAIHSRITTKPFDFGIPHKDKKIKRIYIMVKNEASNYNINFSLSADSKSFETLPNINVYDAGGQKRLTRTIELGERVGKNFQFKFENNNADQPFTIYQYVIEYQVLPRI
jgi:hypothetical protein